MCCLVSVFAMMEHCILTDPLCRRCVSDERLFVIGLRSLLDQILYIQSVARNIDYVYAFYQCLMVFVLRWLRALLSLS